MCDVGFEKEKEHPKSRSALQTERVTVLHTCWPPTGESCRASPKSNHQHFIQAKVQPGCLAACVRREGWRFFAPLCPQPKPGLYCSCNLIYKGVQAKCGLEASCGLMWVRLRDERSISICSKQPYKLDRPACACTA